MAVTIRAYIRMHDLTTPVYFTGTDCEPPNGQRYPRVGGTRQRCFGGTNLKPRKPLENAATPTRRVHAVLGSKNYSLGK